LLSQLTNFETIKKKVAEDEKYNLKHVVKMGPILQHSYMIFQNCFFPALPIFSIFLGYLDYIKMFGGTTKFEIPHAFIAYVTNIPALGITRLSISGGENNSENAHTTHGINEITAKSAH
jgi:hypothetical protein